MKPLTKASRVVLTALALAAFALAGTACEKKLKEAEEARQEVIEDVGGAPKAQVDQARAKLNAAAAKYQGAANAADAVSED